MPDFSIKRGDTEPVIRDTLKRKDGTVIPLNGCTVRFQMRFDKSTLTVDALATVVGDPGEANVEYAWGPTDTVKAGRYRGEWKVTRGNGKVFRVPTRGYIDIEIEGDLGPQP